MQDLDQLDNLAEELKVAPLSKFIDAEQEDTPANWFAPEDVLLSVQALKNHIKINPGSLELEGNEYEEMTLADLTDLQTVLLQAQQENKRFKLAAAM